MNFMRLLVLSLTCCVFIQSSEKQEDDEVLECENTCDKKKSPNLNFDLSGTAWGASITHQKVDLGALEKYRHCLTKCRILYRQKIKQELKQKR